MLDKNFSCEIIINKVANRYAAPWHQKGATVPIALNRLVSISIGRRPSPLFDFWGNKNLKNNR
jgi:hypothetical protein